MLSKLLRPCRFHVVKILALKAPQKQCVRAVWGIPPSQYDMAIPKKLKLGFVLRVYWELIPIFVTMAFSFFVVFYSIAWTIRNKVDVVYTTHSRSNISRTMDLRNPTTHGMMVINQRYEPWPEMQDPCRIHVVKLLALKAPQKQSARAVWGIPASQYDIPISNKFKMGYVCRVYWELIPIFVTNTISFIILFSAIGWARANISRTMNLRYPTVHKVVIINQRYEPWPEMQDVLDKMITAEKRALVRMQSCNTTS
ncbi:Uncharacterized protein OBRU01_15437 [Operophtera brumata]|uniref:Uncharacterized protein n=1 Tax=Operophtera brumata TaxID=104452 RepID=A0A0L7L3J8_OPEBR|nr:Uncharacterized protein OBRU01_15437 [Operophtera brumata]